MPTLYKVIVTSKQSGLKYHNGALKRSCLERSRPPNADTSDFIASIEEILNILSEEGTETVLL